jgi:hypothetical protein
MNTTDTKPNALTVNETPEPKLTDLPVFDDQLLTIDGCRERIVTSGRTRAEHKYLLGKLFLWAKKNVRRGKFMPFVKSTVWFSHATACRMMEYAEKCDREGQFSILRNSPTEGKPAATPVDRWKTIMSRIEKFIAGCEEKSVLLPVETMVVDLEGLLERLQTRRDVPATVTPIEAGQEVAA